MSFPLPQPRNSAELVRGLPDRPENTVSDQLFSVNALNALLSDSEMPIHEGSLGAAMGCARELLRRGLPLCFLSLRR